MRAAILGAGSIGTILGASINYNGGLVDMIDTNKEHVEALNKNGATVKGALELINVPVRALMPDQMEGNYDLVIVTLKQTANQKALNALLPHLNNNSIVCTLQNGLPEKWVAAIVGEDRMLGGTVSMAAQYVSPGIAMMTTDLSRFRIDIATSTGEITPKLKLLKNFLSQGIGVEIAHNMQGIRWNKLLRNVTTSGVSAATGLTFGEMLDDDTIVKVMVHAANECIQVMNALGIQMAKAHDKDFYQLSFSDKVGRMRAIEFARENWYHNRKAIASMLSDMRRGISCEIDYINGEVCAYGDEYNIDTPINDEIVNIIKEFEAGKSPLPSRESVRRFTIPELK